MTLSWEKHRDVSGGVPAESGKEKLISDRETVNGTSVLCVWLESRTKKKDRYVVTVLDEIETYWRLAGGMIPFIRRYSTIWP